MTTEINAHFGLNYKSAPKYLQEILSIEQMQVEAFMEMYNRYQDTETSPVTEPLDRMIERLKQTGVLIGIGLS